MKKIPIFIVNLNKDVEKKEHMQHLCKKNSLDCHFIDAVYGRDLSDDYIEQIYDKDKGVKEIGRELTKGELGCALSHLSIYHKMLDNNIQRAIVLEDDIYLVEDCTKVINSLDRLPNNWELILLGYYSNVQTELATPSSFRYRTSISDKYECVRLVRLAFGTHGYLINLNGAKKLSSQLTTIIKPIDYYTGTDTDINMYAIRPRIVRLHPQYKENSIIETERKAQKKKLELHSTKNVIPIKSRIKNTLKDFGVLDYVMKLKLYYDRVKTLRNYEC
jgi:glycosyl transferase, family 25